MKRKPQIIIGIILIVIFVLLAVAAPLLAHNDPNATDLALNQNIVFDYLFISSHKPV